MRLSHRGEYAIAALVVLSRTAPEKFVPIEHIAQRARVPRKYLEQVLLRLRSGGILDSKPGSRGGYRLARPAAQITVADVLRYVQPEDFAGAPSDAQDPAFSLLGDALRRAQQAALEVLRGLSVEDLAAAREQAHKCPMYYI